MPTIKNGQYADILIRGIDLGTVPDKWLRNKYYRYVGYRRAVMYKGIMYELHMTKQGVLESMGVLYGDETREYNKEFRNLPLAYKSGKKEIRWSRDFEASGIIGIDEGYRWIAEVFMVAGKLFFKDKLSVSKQMIAKAQSILNKVYDEESV